jgi:hypothetical protein
MIGSLYSSKGQVRTNDAVEHDTTSLRSSFGSYNICIGLNAGKYLSYESYCVIVGSGDKQINARGKDMIWVVDWDDSVLNNHRSIKNIIYKYYTNYILTSKDNKKNRKQLVLSIIRLQSPDFKPDTLPYIPLYHY